MEHWGSCNSHFRRNGMYQIQRTTRNYAKLFRLSPLTAIYDIDLKRSIAPFGTHCFWCHLYLWPWMDYLGSCNSHFRSKWYEIKRTTLKYANWFRFVSARGVDKKIKRLKWTSYFAQVHLLTPRPQLFVKTDQKTESMKCHRGEGKMEMLTGHLHYMCAVYIQMIIMYVYLLPEIVALKEYYEIVGESRPLSAFFPTHADFFTEMHFYSWN